MIHITHWLCFLVGVWIGCFVGVLVTYLFVVVRRGDGRLCQYLKILKLNSKTP